MPGELFSLLQESEPLDLPAIIFGPVKTPVGYISCLIRAGETAPCKPMGCVKVSPRIEEPFFVRSNGEKIVITSRKNVTRPPDVVASFSALTMVTNGCRMRSRTH